jgi:hypothetical protein
MLVKEENLKELFFSENVNDKIYAHKKWADKLSDLVNQLFVVIKLKYNLITHQTLVHPTFKSHENNAVIYFRKEDNKDIFSLTFELDNRNEILGIKWTTYDSNKHLRANIKTTKTIRVMTFGFGKSSGTEHCYARTVKSSVELLEQVLKYV